MEEFDKVFHFVKNKYINLLHHVNEYKVIFVENKDLDSMIENTRSIFFKDLYWLYWNFITIQLCALTDKMAMQKKQNLTLRKLADAAEKIDLKCAPQILEKLESIDGKIKPFRTARNQVFGHYDFDSIVNKNEFDKLELDDLEAIFNQTEEIFNLIERELGRAEWIYGSRVHNGAVKFVEFMALGIEMKKEKFKKLAR